MTSQLNIITNLFIVLVSYTCRIEHSVCLQQIHFKPFKILKVYFQVWIALQKQISNVTLLKLTVSVWERENHSLHITVIAIFVGKTTMHTDLKISVRNSLFLKAKCNIYSFEEWPQNVHPLLSLHALGFYSSCDMYRSLYPYWFLS